MLIVASFIVAPKAHGAYISASIPYKLSPV